jgi:hypothetical protein
MKPGTPDTEERRFLSLVALIRRGYTIEGMTSIPEQIESLKFTSPGFVDWLRNDPMAPMTETALTEARDAASPPQFPHWSDLCRDVAAVPAPAERADP